MSRSWNRHICIRLGAAAAELELWRSWPRRRLETVSISLGGNELAVAITAIKQHLDKLAWRGNIQLRLSSRWLRFGMLPWALQSGHDQHDEQAVTGLLANSSGAGEKNAGPAAWSIRLGKARFGNDRLYVAINQTALLVVSSLEAPSRPLQSWEPQLMQAWNRYRHLFTEPAGVVCIPEPGNLSLVAFEAGRITGIRQRQFPANDAEGLVSLLRTEQLRQEKSLYIVLDELPTAWQRQLSGFEHLLGREAGSSSAGADVLPSNGSAS